MQERVILSKLSGLVKVFALSNGNVNRAFNYTSNAARILTASQDNRLDFPLCLVVRK